MNIHTLRNRLAQLAKKEALIDAAKAETQAKVTAIQAAAAVTIGPLIAERDAEEAAIKAEIELHRESLLGPGKTLTLDTHVIAFRSREAVECDDEEAVIESLSAMADDETATPEDRMSAAACLRIPEPKLDKGFVSKNWKRFHAWFTGHGLRKERKETLSLKPLKNPEVEASQS